MRPQPLNRARVGVVVLFALSCFGILLYLWSAFGGSVPLRPAGYRISVAVPESDLLTAQADVRISGVHVGHVVRTENDTAENRKIAVLQIDGEYAPLHRDVRVTLRRKSIGGEMYLELTPGSTTAPIVADGGRLPNANVAPSVELDEVLRAFDPRTKAALRTWLQGQALAIDGRGRDLSDAFGNLAAFEIGSEQLLRQLSSQTGAVRQAVANTGVVFDALAARQAALRGLMVNGRRATDALAHRSQEFADTWRALPAFELESRKLLARADRFAAKANPVISALRPAWRELGPTAQALGPTAVELRALLGNVSRLEDVGVKGLPATSAVLADSQALFREFPGFLEQLAPIVGHLGTYVQDFDAFIANSTAATQGVGGSLGSDRLVHYLRTMAALNLDSLTKFPEHRGPTNRANPYAEPHAMLTKDQPLKVFDDRNCGPAVFPQLGPANPDAAVPQSLIDRVNHYALNDGVPIAPPCVLQRKPGGNYTRLQPLSHP